MFENILTPQFKQIFKDSIDTIISANGLSVPCTIKFDSASKELCYNCIFDSISNRSANIPKDNAPISFPRQTICPVCNGNGILETAKKETINLSIIFDHKYWINVGPNVVNLSDGMVQSLCDISLLPKIKNCQEMIMDTDLSNYGNYRYIIAGDPTPVGLDSHDYIITLWKKL